MSTSSEKPLSNSNKTVFPSIEFRLVFILFFFLFTLFNNTAFAKNQDRFSVFVTNEHNGSDYIRGVGISALHKVNTNNIGIEIDTSLSTAEISDGNGGYQDYLAWELGGKFGYFSDIFLYGEFGFDFGELAFQDRGEDNNRRHCQCNNENYNSGNYSSNYYSSGLHSNLYYNTHDESNDIDFYLGVGTGVDFEHLQLTAYARYRQVDGAGWAAEGRVFSGVKLSASF